MLNINVTFLHFKTRGSVEACRCRMSHRLQNCSIKTHKDSYSNHNNFHCIEQKQRTEARVSSHNWETLQTLFPTSRLIFFLTLNDYVIDTSRLKSYLQAWAKRVVQAASLLQHLLLERVMIGEWDMLSLWITQNITFPALSNSRHVPETLSQASTPTTCQKHTSAHPYLLSHAMPIRDTVRL